MRERERERGPGLDVAASQLIVDRICKWPRGDRGECPSQSRPMDSQPTPATTDLTDFEDFEDFEDFLTSPPPPPPIISLSLLE